MKDSELEFASLDFEAKNWYVPRDWHEFTETYNSK